jgi:hypothetical protein
MDHKKIDHKKYHPKIMTKNLVKMFEQKILLEQKVDLLEQK